MTKWIRLVAAATCLGLGASAHAQLLTERKVFTLPQYTTVGGKTVRNVRIGYESHGRLNAAGDNAIFVAPGYGDSVIGPGKPFDTDRYFILSADTLVDFNARDTVQVQKALADSLGIRRFATVAGPSAGPQVETLHLEGIVDVAKAGEVVRAFLQSGARVSHDRDFDFD